MSAANYAAEAAALGWDHRDSETPPLSAQGVLRVLGLDRDPGGVVAAYRSAYSLDEAALAAAKEVR